MNPWEWSDDDDHNCVEDDADNDDNDDDDEASEICSIEVSSRHETHLFAIREKALQTYGRKVRPTEGQTFL